jgi:hypothetical protein
MATKGKIMAIADRHGLPVAVHVESATPHEVTLVKATIAQRLALKRPCWTSPVASSCCGVYETASAGRVQPALDPASVARDRLRVWPAVIASITVVFVGVIRRRSLVALSGAFLAGPFLLYLFAERPSPEHCGR